MNDHEFTCLIGSIQRDLEAVFCQPKYAKILDLAKDVATFILEEQIDSEKVFIQRKRGHFDTTCVTFNDLIGIWENNDL